MSPYSHKPHQPSYSPHGGRECDDSVGLTGCRFRHADQIRSSDNFFSATDISRKSWDLILLFLLVGGLMTGICQSAYLGMMKCNRRNIQRAHLCKVRVMHQHRTIHHTGTWLSIRTGRVVVSELLHCRLPAAVRPVELRAPGRAKIAIRALSQDLKSYSFTQSNALVLMLP